MNEIKMIHLGRQPFTISVEAHRALRAYLDAIEHQVGKKGEDVLKEIELRMAELLTERGITGDKVVLAEDVDFLQEQLGKPGDFKDEGPGRSEEAAESNLGGEDADGVRRLYRDTDTAMIAGVASGLAAYFHVDALIIRLLFVVLTLTGGAGILMYVLLWVLVPEAKSPSDRLQMRGKAVTVDNIKQFVGRTDLPAAAGRVTKTSARVFRIIGKLVRIFLGVTVILIATALFTAAMVGGAYMFTQGVQVAGNRIFPWGAQEVVGVASALAVVALLSLGLLFAGDAVLRRKWVLPSWIVAAGIALMIAALSTASIIGIDNWPKVKERYANQRITTSLTLPAFSEIQLEGKDTDLVYKYASDYKMEVTYFGQKNVDELIGRESDGKVLLLNTTKYNKETDCVGLCLNNYDDLRITVYGPKLEAVDVQGDSSTFEADSVSDGQDLTMRIGKDSIAFIQHSEISKARVDTAGPRGSYVVILEGLRTSRSDMSATTIQVSPEYGVILPKADEVQLRTLEGETCDANEALLELSEPAGIIQINDKSVDSLEALRRLQNSEGLSLYNCLDVAGAREDRI